MRRQAKGGKGESLQTYSSPPDNSSFINDSDPEDTPLPYPMDFRSKKRQRKSPMPVRPAAPIQANPLSLEDVYKALNGKEDDCFDYAIELFPDDRYRIAAMKLSKYYDLSKVEFVAYDANEFELKHNDVSPEGTEQESIRPFTRKSDVSNSSDAMSSEYDQSDRGSGIDGGIMSRSYFSRRMRELEDEKVQVQYARRRSTLDFYARYSSLQCPETIREDFFNRMRAPNKLILRRLVAGDSAPMVKLTIVEKDGYLESIKWAEISSAETHRLSLNGELPYAEYDDTLGLSFFAALCSCGELTNTHSINVCNLSGMLTNLRSMFVKPRVTQGSISLGNILHVMRSTACDPVFNHVIGTPALRGTRDAYDTARTFSVIIRGDDGRIFTLDVECADLEEFYVLFLGFKSMLVEKQELLERDADEREKELKHLSISATPKSQHSIRSWSQRFATARRQSLSSTLSSTLSSKDAEPEPSSAAIEQVKKQLEEVSTANNNLYEDVNTVDVVRYMQVGGGLTTDQQWKEKLGSAEGLVQKVLGVTQIPACLLDSHTDRKKLQLVVSLTKLFGRDAPITKIWCRLHVAGLRVKLSFSANLSRVILKLSAPIERLQAVATSMKFRMRTLENNFEPYTPLRATHFYQYNTRSDSLDVNAIGGQTPQEALLDGGTYSCFRACDRQHIIDYIIRAKEDMGGADLDVDSNLGQYIVQRFPLHLEKRLLMIQREWVTFWKLPETMTDYRWYHQVKYFFSRILIVPLDAIAEYFGESIGFYNALLAFYTRWLIFPSILGIVAFAFQMSGGKMDHWVLIPFSMVITFWMALFIAFWKLRAATLANQWGVLGYENSESQRPQFTAEVIEYEKKGRLYRRTLDPRRFCRFGITIPLFIAMVILVLVLMAVFFHSQDRLYDDYVAGNPLDLRPSFPSLQISSSDLRPNQNNESSEVMFMITFDDMSHADFWLSTCFYPMLYGICASVVQTIFRSLAVWMNDLENHRTHSMYMNHLIMKVFSFQFVSTFTSLYYYTFFSDNAEAAFIRVSVTIFSLMTMGQWWNVIMDICVPQLLNKIIRYRMQREFDIVNQRIEQAQRIVDTHRAVVESTNSDERAADILTDTASTSHTISSAATNGSGEMTVKESALYDLEQSIQQRKSLLQQAKDSCWQQAVMAPYSTHSDYTALVIEMCFILFFSCVFPLAPLIAVINNILLLRVNAYKLCVTRQRPCAHRAGGIGVWADILQILSVAGAVTSIAILGFVANTLQNFLGPVLGQSGVVLVMFIYEQLLLLLKFWFHRSTHSQLVEIKNARYGHNRSVIKTNLKNNQKDSAKNSTNSKSVHGDTVDQSCAMCLFSMSVHDAIDLPEHRRSEFLCKSCIQTTFDTPLMATNNAPFSQFTSGTSPDKQLSPLDAANAAKIRHSMRESLASLGPPSEDDMSLPSLSGRTGSISSSKRKMSHKRESLMSLGPPSESDSLPSSVPNSPLAYQAGDEFDEIENQYSELPTELTYQTLPHHDNLDSFHIKQSHIRRISSDGFSVITDEGTVLNVQNDSDSEHTVRKASFPLPRRKSSNEILPRVSFSASNPTPSSVSAPPVAPVKESTRSNYFQNKLRRLRTPAEDLSESLRKSLHFEFQRRQSLIQSSPLTRMSLDSTGPPSSNPWDLNYDAEYALQEAFHKEMDVETSLASIEANFKPQVAPTTAQKSPFSGFAKPSFWKLPPALIPSHKNAGAMPSMVNVSQLNRDLNNVPIVTQPNVNDSPSSR